jgi:hypothetical protein
MNNDYLLTALSLFICSYNHKMFQACLFTRIIRIIAIYLVTFPNPNPESHIVRHRSHDLIISGHTIQWNFIFIYVYENFHPIITFLFGLLLTLYYIDIIKKKHHYSVDIFLALYISTSMYMIVKYIY